MPKRFSLLVPNTVVHEFGSKSEADECHGIDTIQLRSEPRYETESIRAV